ncbi:DUF4249 domain-containing protein [Carboxylicivirga marina]|uniref:DUF4249 domain-containing protein n=1 Tax=Carboxylicivirga marina TaxID=2800988 RepID=UPI002592A02E|nr:DUF4249 domain-containing protein [uncultured Carboxylicivirga sp.]
MNGKITSFFLVLICFTSCLEPYDVNITDYEDLLVVDALITDEQINHRVYLSRSIPNLDEIPQRESNALVIITDQNNKEEVLTEIEPGVYETDKEQFVPIIGGTYTLTIRTSRGIVYQSTPCTLLPKIDIDNVSFKAGKEWNSDETMELQGLNILVDGVASEGNYLRWLYEEDWQFKTPFPTRMAYDFEIDDWVYITPINHTCWKEDAANSVVIHSFANQNAATIKDKKVCFVPSKETDKLTVRYSILVKQLCISKEEYEFWNKLKVTTDDVGDVFGVQPFSIVGNIKNINDDKEPVLGYFQTGSVDSERIYIDRSDVTNLGLPVFSRYYNCSVDSFKYEDFPDQTPLEIYNKFVLSGVYNLNDAIYDEDTGAMVGFLLARPICSDCTLTGTSEKPDFWED